MRRAAIFFVLLPLALVFQVVLDRQTAIVPESVWPVMVVKAAEGMIIGLILAILSCVWRQ